MNSASIRYTLGAIYLHWTIAILMIFMLFFGDNLIKHQTSNYYPTFHASLGFAILILTFVRLGWRLANPPPALPSTMKALEITVSHVTHWLFYVLMIGLPLTGMMAFTSAVTRKAELVGTSLFGLVGVPMLPNLGGIGGGAHSIGSNIGQVLVILHVAAALKHQFWDKDNILRRMSPH